MPQRYVFMTPGYQPAFQLPITKNTARELGRNPLSRRNGLALRFHPLVQELFESSEAAGVAVWPKEVAAPAKSANKR
jgi:hypothetical protein